jgi:superfamily II DNA or RNA helicase
MVTWDEAEKIFRATDPKFEAWSPSQRDAYLQWGASLKRQLLFFPTGKGKTKTALALIATRGHKRVVVIAPPATHGDWIADAKALGLDIRIDSVQKFRMENTKYSKSDVAWIIDEFHQMGGHSAAGWKKLNRMMRTFQGDIVLASATPNYNDAERVFCLTAIGDEAPGRNYINWLWDNCNCQMNRFSRVPDVDKDTPFKNYDSAIDFLLSRPWVSYIEDTATWTPRDLYLPAFDDDLFERYNINRRKKRIMNSEMEKRHARINHRFIDEEGLIREEILDEVSLELSRFPDRTKWMVFCAHKTVAQALKRTLSGNTWLIDGDTPKTNVDPIKNEFINAQGGWLIGTTAIATGMDGIDKVCTSMLILDDIDGDPSLRRQLIGRILPRGAADARPRLVVTATF